MTRLNKKTRVQVSDTRMAGEVNGLIKKNLEIKFLRRLNIAQYDASFLSDFDFPRFNIAGISSPFIKTCPTYL
ncbi:hypothetical protein SAE01_44020 [Segetibacter aerophilus]|uniref:Uncharacterized protein n=1 Tax=Segetibacter aerophilus TaxID=670293 RepID=A0A512BIW3_9BACT|nr:hypothetical protein SAE01_44020 [Segetibacter aerophilus]